MVVLGVGSGLLRLCGREISRCGIGRRCLEFGMMGLYRSMDEECPDERNG